MGNQNVRKTEHLGQDRKKQYSATVAKSQREILDEEEEVHSTSFPQDHGTEIVAGSSNKNKLKSSSGENPLCSVNHGEKELTHYREPAKVTGATEEISTKCWFRQSHPKLLRSQSSLEGSSLLGCWCRWSSVRSATGQPPPRRSCRGTLQGTIPTIGDGGEISELWKLHG